MQGLNSHTLCVNSFPMFWYGILCEFQCTGLLGQYVATVLPTSQGNIEQNITNKWMDNVVLYLNNH